MSDEKPMGQVIQIDEARIRDHLGEMVRGTVEETLNAMLCRSRPALRCRPLRAQPGSAGHPGWQLTLQTSAGEVNLKIPKLRRQTFETAIIERYRRRESSVEGSLLEMSHRNPRQVVMKRTWAGEVRNVSLMVASAVNSEGFQEILGICEGAKEDKSGWSAFLRHLVDRGLTKASATPALRSAATWTFIMAAPRQHATAEPV
jgi:putative transposase